MTHELSFFALLISISANAETFTPQNDCKIQEVKSMTSTGFELKGFEITSFDQTGVKSMKELRTLESRKTEIQKKEKKLKQDFQALTMLESEIQELKKKINHHRITAFWPHDDYARDRARNSKIGPDCHESLVENGVQVLNPKSNLRSSCLRKGLDLPSLQEAEALLTCFAVPDPKSGALRVKEQELQKVVPAMDQLYFATKTINPRVSGKYNEHVYGFCPFYGGQMPISETQATEDYMGIQCMSRKGP